MQRNRDGPRYIVMLWFKHPDAVIPNLLLLSYNVCASPEGNERLLYIAQICTAGSYVPDRAATVQDHLSSPEQQLQHTMASHQLWWRQIGDCQYEQWQSGQKCGDTR